MMKKNVSTSRKGAVLVIALLILLVLTLIGISAINTTNFETTISGNERVGTDAFYAAEAGVQDGIHQLQITIPIARKALGRDSFYWSGTPQDKPNGAPLRSLGVYHRSGFDSSWVFTRFQVNGTGESFGANREIEVQVTCGPFSAGTIYNN
jgi:Tfp pilus assembly protein PilX